MNRRVGVYALAALILAAASALAAPWAVRVVVEGRVDDALQNIRIRSTSVVNRGEVTVALASRTVVIHGLTIDPPGGGSKIRIGALTMIEPWPSEGRLTARRIVFDDVIVLSGADRTAVPRIELQDYSGPEEGLVTTPGAGPRAASQAEVIGQVSVGGISIPLIELVAGKTGTRRSLKNISVTRLVNGVIESASIEDITVEAPAGKNPAAPPVQVTASAASLAGLSLPTLWRFYAGERASGREPLLKEISASRLALRVGGASRGEITIRAATASARGVQLRPLTFPFAEVDELLAKLKDEEALTPADLRQQILMIVEGARALSFDAIELSRVRAEQAPRRGGGLSATIRSVSVGPYADARLEQVTIEGLTYSGTGSRSLQVSHAQLRGFDASRLAAYAERIGRDEIMLTTQPTADDVVLTAPRIQGLELRDARYGDPDGAFALASARVDVDAPLDAVPQHLGLELNGVEVTPDDASRLAATIRRIGLTQVKGAGRLSMTLDPNTRELSLNSLKTTIEDLGAIDASGSLAKVDPLLAISGGQQFIDQLSAIILEPFKITVRNDGLFETALQRAARNAAEPDEVFRAALAVRASDEISTLFGPPARQSAEALAAFIRQPIALEITINPKTPDTRLIDLLQSLRLGPAGIAQTIDVKILNRR
ncbi:hypothetical protein ACIKTA_05945 [Hansschlegelia beijingensis]